MMELELSADWAYALGTVMCGLGLWQFQVWWVLGGVLIIFMVAVSGEEEDTITKTE